MNFLGLSKGRFLHIFLSALMGALILGIILGLKGAANSYIFIFSFNTFIYLVYNFVFYFFPFVAIAIILFFSIRLIETIISKKFSVLTFLSIGMGFFIALNTFIIFIPWLHLNLLVRHKFLVRIGIVLDMFIIIAFLSLWILIGFAMNKLVKACSLHKIYLGAASAFFCACIVIYIIILPSVSQGNIEINNIDFQTVDVSKYSPFKKNKIILIGVDGATFNIIRPMVKEGKLPHFKQLMENGCWGELSTLIPTSTPVIWTSIATGKIPFNQGVYFLSKSYLKGMNRPVHFRMIPQFVGTNKMYILFEMLGLLHSTPASSLDRKVPALWNIFSKSGLKVGLIRYPVTWPAEKVNGFLISDRFHYSSLDHTCYPSEFQKFVNSVKEEIQSQNYDLLQKYPDISDYFILDKITEELAVGLSNNIDTDLFIAYFKGIDSLGHLYWKYYQPNSMVYKPSNQEIKHFKDVIPDYYQYIDRVIGRIIDQKKGYTIIIASDHGMEAQPQLLTGSYMAMPSGNHNLKQPGILIISGPCIKRGIELEQISILDLTPTILALVGLPVAKDMDGRIISEAFNKNYLSIEDLQFIESYGKRLVKSSDVDKKSPVDKAMIEKLKSLGYIH